MFKLKKCRYCGFYTLKENCVNCGRRTEDSHYKYLKIKNSEKNETKGEN
jgi:rRNA maturation protein Nop10